MPARVPMRSLPFVVLLACTVAALAAEPALVGEQAWIREAPPNAPVLAGYVDLVNRGAAPVVVTGARSAEFARVELHAMSHAEGVMRMRPLERLEVAVGARVALTPGGNHLMLIQPARALAAGDRVDVELALDGGSSLVVTFEVRR